MKNYIDDLIMEYKEATGLEYQNQEFTKWILKKKNHLENYYEFLTYLGLDDKNKILEFDKGSLDSISLVVPNKKEIFIISKYADTFKDKNISASFGSIKSKNNIPYLINNGNWIHEIPNDIITYLVENPDRRMLYELKSLIMQYKDIYIGTCGDISDLNKNQKIKKLEQIKDDLLFEYNVGATMEKIKINSTYIAAIKMQKL